jgi:RHS repeat-associated protein
MIDFRRIRTPVTISSQSYPTTLAYNSWLGVTQTTGANGEQMSMTYDGYGRPTSGTSPYQSPYCYCGPTESYSYGTSAPFTQTKTGTDGKTVTTLDGLGRAIRVDRGDTTSMHSSTATVYAPCACSPLAKIQKTSQPYVYGSSASAWTTYTYDGLGRPLTVQQPDGASTTTYVYSGNVTTVTEPDPATPPSGTLTTTYTYDWMNHVTGVSMTRSGTTQTRSFVFDNAGRLTSATNPENGTLTYAYGSNNAVQMKTDAKGQQTVYSYDSLSRLTMTQYYPTGTANPEDGCQRVTYSYDTNPINPSFSQNSSGRLTAIQYGANTIGSSVSSFCVAGEWTSYIYGTAGTYANNTMTSFAEMYSYHPAGGVTAKQLYMSRVFYSGGGYCCYTENADVEVDYTYDNAGRTATTTYPMTYGGSTPTSPVTLTYGYDSMGRPNALTDLSGVTGTGYGWPSGTPVNWAQNAQYDYAGRMASMQYFTGFNYFSGYLVQTWSQKSMGYNVNGQLTSLSWVENPYGIYGGFGGPSTGIQYNYSATQNNGQITQAVDTLSGETINYQYDALKRLTSASSTPNFGSYPAAYTQAFQYDGFGNLTAKVLNGTSTPIPVNAANNRLSSASYDASGNMTSGSGATMVYDEANRIFSAAAISGGTDYYAYTADNKRFYTYTASTGAEQVTLYGARGEKLGVYSIVNPNIAAMQPLAIYPVATNIWFAGKAILESGNPSMMDRQGTNRYTTSSAYSPRFYPYGDEITSRGNDREKFATYTRDSYTGFDYADQRYYASTYGRFNSPDPYQASGGPSSPASWNRYSYVGGDPINRYDPRGLLSICPDGLDVVYEGSADGFGGASCTSDPTGMAYWGDDYGGCGNQDPLSPFFSSTRVCDQPGQGGQLPGGGGGACLNWCLMSAAVNMAVQALKDSPQCEALYGTGATRAGGWNPITVLQSVFSPGGGEFGGAGFANLSAYGPTAVTTPALFGDPPTAVGGFVLINSTLSAPGTTAWNNGDTTFNAETLLHELGHIYDWVPASGGSKIHLDPFGIGSSDNDITVIKNCFTVQPVIRRPRGH